MNVLHVHAISGIYQTMVKIPINLDLGHQGS